MSRVRLLRRVPSEGGYTMVELIAVMAILLTVLSSLTALFVSGAKAELELNKRFQAQQAARVAADRLRREVHCSSGVTGTASAISVTLPKHCPTVGGVVTTIVYDTQAVGASRYRLRRAGVTIADYLTTGDVFSYYAPSTSSLGKLHLDFPINVNPNEGWKRWRLVTDIVLRNTKRQ